MNRLDYLQQIFINRMEYTGIGPDAAIENQDFFIQNI